MREAAGPPGAPTVVLLHGWTQTADTTWWRVYERLSAFATVVAVDQRGHGRGLRSIEPFTLEAAADDVAGLLRALGHADVVAVGYSMGGPITLLLQHRHPDLVAGVVLQATALEWSSSWRDRLTWRFMGLVEWLLKARTRSVFGRLVRECVESCPDLEPYRPWLLAELGRGEPRTMADAGRALGQFDGRPLAAAVDVPAAVVVMRYDHLVAPSKQRALGRAIPGGTVFELDADHDACLTSPDAFPAVTEQAVRRVLGDRG